MITKRTREYESKLSRRSLILGGIQSAFIGGLAARLYFLQVVQGNQYSQLSDRNKYDFRIIPPSRGRLYDAKGRLLAGNAEAYELSIIPDYAGDVRQVLKVLSALIELSEEDIELVLKESADQPSFLPVPIRSDLTQREVARLVVRSPELPGVNFARIEKRIYPQGLIAGHLTGYVNRVNKDEIKDGLITRELANLSIGKSGVEKALEDNLRGAPGRKRVVVNALGRPIRSFVDEESEPGRDFRLSIDMDLQLKALETLKVGRHKILPRNSARVRNAIEADPVLSSIVEPDEGLVLEDIKGRVVPPETGSVVVIDIQTGELKCLVSSPTFDPNLFSGRISSTEWNRIIGNPRRPLLDRALSGQYAPGSTFKMVVALAALEAGVINEKTRYSCPGHKTVGNQDFHCWKKEGHGSVNIIRALEQSCDVYFYEVGLKTGITRIADMARRLGLGDVTLSGLPGEKPGLVPTKDWKENKIGSVWTLGETVNASIGQGYVLATPMQLAVMTARIANGEARINPTLFSGQASAEPEPLDISPRALSVIRKGMRQVMDGPLGTARNHDLNISGIAMSGKTGTVQVKAISKAEREEGIIDNMDRPWKHRDHALFVGYAPHDKPRYAVAVVVEHGGSGSSVAAPIASDVLSYVFRENGV